MKSVLFHPCPLSVSLSVSGVDRKNLLGYNKRNTKKGEITMNTDIHRPVFDPAEKSAKEEPLSAANRDPGGNPDSKPKQPASVPPAKAPAAPEPVPVREPAPVPRDVPPKKRSKAPLIAAACLLCAAAALAAVLLLRPSRDGQPILDVPYPADSTKPAQDADTLPPETEAPRETLSPEDRLYLEVSDSCAAMAASGDFAAPLDLLREYTWQDDHDPRFDALLTDYEQRFIADRLSAAAPLTNAGDHCRAIRDLDQAYRILECPEFEDAMARIRLEFGRYASSQIAAGKLNTFLLHADGTVDAYGHSMYGELQADRWSGITAISAGDRHVVGLRSDGTVVAAGSNDVGQMNVGSWYDIVSISAGDTHTVGLKADGTLVAAGFNEEYQCDMQALMRNAGEKRIVGIAAGYGHTLALLADGTVAATGVNQYGECDVYHWTDIVAIVAGSEISAGLRSDGTVVATGLNTENWHLESWQDIVCLAAGDYYLVGLKADGTVVAAGTDDYNYSERGQIDVYGWSGISMIAAGNDHTVALRSDGTVLCIGSDDLNQCQCNGYALKLHP